MKRVIDYAVKTEEPDKSGSFNNFILTDSILLDDVKQSIDTRAGGIEQCQDVDEPFCRSQLRRLSEGRRRLHGDCCPFDQITSSGNDLSHTGRFIAVFMAQTVMLSDSGDATTCKLKTKKEDQQKLLRRRKQTLWFWNKPSTYPPHEPTGQIMGWLWMQPQGTFALELSFGYFMHLNNAPREVDGIGDIQDVSSQYCYFCRSDSTPQRSPESDIGTLRNFKEAEDPSQKAWLITVFYVSPRLTLTLMIDNLKRELVLSQRGWTGRCLTTNSKRRCVVSYHHIPLHTCYNKSFNAFLLPLGPIPSGFKRFNREVSSFWAKTRDSLKNLRIQQCQRRQKQHYRFYVHRTIKPEGTTLVWCEFLYTALISRRPPSFHYITPLFTYISRRPRNPKNNHLKWTLD